MRRIILFRHAKSSWGDPGLADHDRPLNQRGRLVSALMGAFLVDQGLKPDLVLLSSSARTVETWERAKGAFAESPPSEVREALYHADPQTMLNVLRDLPKFAETAMLVGHNPGMAACARRFSNGSASASCIRAFDKFPTGALAVFEADVKNWTDVEFGRCAFTRYVMPKELV